MCPACSAHYAVMPSATVAEARARSPTNKTAWRSKSLKLPKPANEGDEVEEAATEIAPVTPDDAPGAGPDDDLVLEQEPDDGDVSDLVVKDTEPGDR